MTAPLSDVPRLEIRLSVFFAEDFRESRGKALWSFVWAALIDDFQAGLSSMRMRYLVCLPSFRRLDQLSFFCVSLRVFSFFVQTPHDLSFLESRPDSICRPNGRRAKHSHPQRSCNEIVGAITNPPTLQVVVLYLYARSLLHFLGPQFFSLSLWFCSSLLARKPHSAHPVIRECSPLSLNSTLASTKTWRTSAQTFTFFPLSR